MIDLKTVKNITISEGSVTKITNSSGVVLWEVKSTSEQTPCYYVAKNVSDLPQGLYQAEYAQIGYQKFLITDYHWNVNSKAVVQFEINSCTNEYGKYGRILAIEGEGAFSSYQSAWDVENTTWQTKPFGSTSWNRSTVVPNLNQKYVGEYAETGLTIDGTVITATTPSTSITANTSHYVCIGGYNTTDQTEYLDGKIYSVKIYESGTLVRDIVPLTTGLFYDKLSKKVYAAGAGGVCETGGTSTLLVKNESKYDMAYVTSEKRWYALNNKSQWEKYGVIETVSSLDNLTAYDGKLVYNETDKHEYKYANNAWSDQGEVKVSTNVASLPSSFGFNYNAKNFDETTQTLKNDSGASVATDVVLRTGYNDSDSLTNYKIIGNDHITINSDIFGIIKGYNDYINRSSSNPTLTIIAKVSESSGFSVFANRTISSTYNYMFRVYENYLTLHGSNEQGRIEISKKPSIIGLTVDSSRTLTYFNKTDNLTSTYQNFNYGSINNGDSVLFEGYGDYNSEPWRGDFYWIFMSNQTLTENEIEDVINHNENVVEIVYPVSYEQYDAPNLNYTECANEAAMKALSCPYEGMIVKLTDTGKKYKFTYNSALTKYEWVEYSASLDVDLNNQWVASTKTLDGYLVYMSNSNHNVDNGYASMKFKFKGQPDFKLWINSYAESNYDYTIAWNIDVDYPTSNPSNSTTGVKANTRGNQYNPTNITAFTEVDYANDGGEHFVVVTYRKDSSASDNDDRGYVAVRLTLISTTWVVSSTEFVKKDGKYYEKLTEVNTYEGGVTANTGNYKEGNELPVTYKQGTADDFMVVGSGKYYKKYAYVTINGKEVNTGDYIQGDYIGNITNAAYVKYVDGSTKMFNNLTTIGSSTISDKYNAKEVFIGEGVTEIGSQAFYRCSNLVSITIPNSVKTIGGTAFGDDSHLAEVTIGTGLTTIQQYAFTNCISLTGVSLSDSLTTIGIYAFADCKSITSIIIPANVTSIGRSGFNGCSNLASVTVKKSNGKISYQSDTFDSISPKARLYVPDSLVSQYKSDSNLTNDFKNGIYGIGYSMKLEYDENDPKEFYDLTTINQNTDSTMGEASIVRIGNTVTEIGEYAFSYNGYLETVYLGDNVKSIGDYAFDGCYYLDGMEFPTTLTNIGKYAFYNCTALSSVTIQNSFKKLVYNTDAFTNISSTAKLYVPSNLLSDYQADSSWSNAFKGGIYAIGT